MKKQLLACAVTALCAFSANSALLPAAPGSGDLAFTAFNADEDGFAMVSLVDLSANTKVYFSDNEWTGSAFNTGESFSSWVSGGSTIAAGTVIRFLKTDNATALAASIGTLSRETVSGSTNWGYSQTEDTLYAYLGTSAVAPTTFLSAVSTSTFGSPAGGSLTNTGLAVGAGAVQLSFGSDFAQYAGARAGQPTFAGYKALVSNASNWNDSGEGSFAASVPNTLAFSISAVPEPESYAMLMAGLGLVSVIARRRKAK